ncbi:MAG: hypothetical protein K5686_04465 [Lachnospiraceae bacterium]|nr:hypothetical protein [Lachnospiraceae bacterium]
MKKRVMALLLSTVMVLGETMTVFAQEDTVEVVEEAVVEAEEEDEAEEVVVETEDNTDVYVEDAAVVEEADVNTASDAAESAISNTEDFVKNISFDQSDVITKEVLGYDEEGNEQFKLIISAPGASLTGKYAYVNNKTTLNITGVDYSLDGKTIMLNSTVEYLSKINYRAKKISPEKDLAAKIVKSGLYDVAKSLSPTGTATDDVIKWKITAKKNKNAGAAAYFTIKASVNKKAAKNCGITGKNLKKLKKAAKILNKAAKKEKAFFVIDPIVLDYCPLYLEVFGYSRFGINTITKVKLHAPLKEGEENYYGNETKMKKWPVIPSKEYKAKKQGGLGTWKVTIIPKQKSVVGGERVFTPNGI